MMTTTGHTNMRSRAIELVLEPHPELPRYLHISLRGQLFDVSVHVNNLMAAVAFAFGNMKDGYCDPRGVYLHISWNGSGALFVSGATFDLASSEVEIVKAAYLPFGLHIQDDSVSTTRLDPRAVKESAPVVVPLDGRRGMSLASALGASALDLSNKVGRDG